MRVTVIGATGVIGQALLPHLRGEHDVVAVARRPHDDNSGVTWVKADVSTGKGLKAALDGANVAYYLVHSLGARDYERKDLEAARNVSRYAARAGVDQLVYLGGLGGDEPDSSPHLRSRRESGENLAAHGVPVTTLRAAMVIGKGSAAFETILALVKRLPVMITPSWVSTPTQPIAIQDIARFLAGVAGNHRTLGEAFDVGGPEVMTYRQMIERIAALLGRHPQIVEVPFLTPRLSALWLELVSPVNASVARPLVEGLRNPTIAREERLHALLGYDLTSFDDAARLALES